MSGNKVERYLRIWVILKLDVHSLSLDFVCRLREFSLLQHPYISIHIYAKKKVIFYILIGYTYDLASV